MSARWAREVARPGWGWGALVGGPLLLLGKAAEGGGNDGLSLFLFVTGIVAIWICVGQGPAADSLREFGAARSAASGPSLGGSGNRVRPGNLSGAHRLAAKLKAGKIIDTIPASFRLREGEQQHGRFENTTLYGWFGIDVPYKTVHNRAFHPVGWAIDATVHKAINKANAASAAAKGAPKWREAAAGTLHLTSQRLVFDDGLELHSWWFTSIVATENEGDTIVLRLEDAPAVMLRLKDAYVLLVGLHHLAWNEIPVLPADVATVPSSLP